MKNYDKKKVSREETRRTRSGSHDRRSYGEANGNDSSKFPMSKPNDKYNDVSWYAKNQQILKDAASFSYNQPLGSEIPTKTLFNPDLETIAGGASVAVQYNRCSRSVPGVMTLYTGITPGLSDEYNSPLNLAAQNIYSYVRYMNSGAKNYDPNDLMLYLLAMDSAYACWNFYKRIYGLIKSYDQSNWYLPRTLIETAGCDFDDLRLNIADFRQYLNVTAAKLSSFCTPAVMPLFIRHSWMFSNIWADASQPKAQHYQFAPLYFYRYDEAANPQGGMLTPASFITLTPNATYPTHQQVSSKTLVQMRQYLDSLIDNLQLSEDIGVMSGDILKAYGQSNLFKLAPVLDDYTVTPVYNEEVLGQIHNATMIASEYKQSDIDSCVVTQDIDRGRLRFVPVFTADSMR